MSPLMTNEWGHAEGHCTQHMIALIVKCRGKKRFRQGDTAT